MQSWRDYFCKPCSASVTSPQEDMEYRMGSCIGVARSQAAVHTDKVSPPKEKSAATENGSVHPESITAETQVTADEEEKPGRQGEEDKEELEFPHDLLPSLDLDLSTELNLTWGTTLGEQVSLGDMKNETVALGGTANPLLAGLEHYMEASSPVVGLMKSCDGDQVSTESASLTQVHLPSTPQQDVPSLNPLVRVDYELQEAFKECEDEMAALGKSSIIDTWTAGDLNKCFPLVLPGRDEKTEQTKMSEVKEDSFDSSSHKLAEFHQGCHGNDGAHTNDSTAGEEGVFSFRDYVLGKDLGNMCTAESKDVRNIKNITENPREESSQLSEAEQQTKSIIEPKIDTAESIAVQQTTHSTWTGTQTASEKDVAKEALTPDQSIQDACNSKCSLDDVVGLSETVAIKEANLVNKYVINSATATQMIENAEMHSQMISDLLPCPSTHMDKHAGDTWDSEAKISVQPNIQKQVESGTRQQISEEIKTKTNVGSSLENQKQELQLPEQLCREDKQLMWSPPSVLEVHQAHLTLADNLSAKILHPLQGLQQHDDQDQTDGPYKSISVVETIYHCTTGEVKHEKNVSDASAVVIDFCKAKTDSEYEPKGRCDLEKQPPEQENGPLLGGGAGTHAPVWGNSHSPSRARTEEEEEEESALERASAESAASTLLQTTPTMPEMIESEGEKKRDDAFQSAAIIVQAAERESAVLDTDESPSSEGTLSEITAEEGQECTLLIFPKIKCSPVQIEETTEESCGNKIAPKKSTENEKKGGGLPTALFLAGDKDTGTVSTEDKAAVTCSSPGILGTCDWKVESSLSKEKKGESEKEEKETSEGGAENAAHAGRVSQTETVKETCPSHRITASQTAPEDRSDFIHPVTTGTALFPLTINRINDCDSISPPPPLSLINSTEAEAQREDKANQNSSPSASGAELPGSDLLLPPANSSKSESLAVQANNQQVQSALQTKSANCDTSIKTESQQQKQETILTREDTSQSTNLQENMRDITGCCTKMEGHLPSKGLQSSFKDQKDAALTCQMTECASLPPLMVFESLRHPVKEASFNFVGFLSISKAELPSQTEPEVAQRTTVLDAIAEEESSVKNETSQEECKGEENCQQIAKVEQEEIKSEKPKNCTETTSQEQGEATVNPEENVYVNMGGCEESGKVTDETPDASKSNPVKFSSLSTADETAGVTETKDVGNETREEIKAIKEEEEYKEALNTTQISHNESASSEKNSVLLQDVSEQEGHNCSLAVDLVHADNAVSAKVEQINQIEETDETKGYGLPEAGGIETKFPNNSKNLVNDSQGKQSKYTCEEGSEVKTSLLPQTAVLDADSTYQDKNFTTEQPTETSEMPLLPKVDTYADVEPCQTESQFSAEMMKSDGMDAEDEAVPSLTAVEITVPAQRDLSSSTTQSTNSVARDVSVIVLKAPGPMLSHCESISDCDIAVAETREHCSVKCVCESDPEIVKNIADKTNLDANEDMLSKQNANHPPYTVGASAQETAASSGSLLLTTDRPEQAGGSLLMSKKPDIVGNTKMKENEEFNDTVQLKIVREEKRKANANSKLEDNSCKAPTSVISDDEVVNKDTSEGRQVKREEHNNNCAKDTQEKASSKQEESISQEDGNEQKNMEQDRWKEQEEMAFRELKDSREKTNTSEVPCADKMLHSQITLIKQQTPKDDIICDSLLMPLEDKLGTRMSEEPVQRVSVDNVKIKTNLSEAFRQGMSEEKNKECVQEHENSITENDSKECTNNSQKQDESVKENMDQTRGENQTLMKLFEIPEENLINETIPKGKFLSSSVPDSGVIFKGTIEKTVDHSGPPTEKSLPVIDQTSVALRQSDLAFPQSQELQQQQMFISAPEAVLSLGKSCALKNAETNNHADADASEKQEKVTVYCSAEAKSSPDSTSESAELVEGHHRDFNVDSICPQNEDLSIPTKELRGEKSHVCGESTLSETQTQPAPNLPVNAVSGSETSEFKRVIKALEVKQFVISASQESVNKHADCSNSQVSADEYGNVWNKTLATKKGAELPVSHSSGLSASPSVLHYEEGIKTDEHYLDFVTPGDTGNTEIRPDSVSEVAQMSAAEPSQLQQEKELIFQPSDAQCSSDTARFSATALEESIKEEKEISVDQASKDALKPNAPNSTPESETAAWRMEQLNKHLSEQFPDGTQNTEKQHTLCSEKQLTQLQHAVTCSGTENQIGTMKAEDTFSNDRQEPQGIQEETSKQINETAEKCHMELSKGTGPNLSENVGKESMSKENQSKVEAHSLSASEESIVCNVDQPIEIATDGVLIEMDQVVSLLCPETASCVVTYPQDCLQPPFTVNQQSIEQHKSSSDTLKSGSEEHPEIANSSPANAKAIQKDDSEASEEKVNMVSQAADDGLLGSGPGAVQVKDSTDTQTDSTDSANFVPERSNKVNSSEGSDWLRVLKEAASMSQVIPEHKDETTCGSTDNRPFESFGSPQAELEFRTPTGEFLPPAPEESFPPGPEETFPPAPEDSFPPGPVESFPLASEDTFPPAPEDNFPPPPEESFPPVPEEIFPPAPEESFPLVTEQPEEASDCRSPLLEAAEWSEPVPSPSSLPPQHSFAPALPAHLLQDTLEFPTPPPTPPDRAPAEPQTFPPAPDPSDLPQISPDFPLPPPVQQLQHSEPSARSSDSDGAFETPESTTPVKSVSPSVPPTEHPYTSSETLSPKHTASSSDVPASEGEDPSLHRSPSRSDSTAFDEDKPIAASGTYNLEYLISNDPFPESNFGSGSSRAPLTRSQSLQSGELESPGNKSPGISDKPIHPRTESFNIGTESAPGTLRRVKKPRPGSLKKKPLSRQNSNPERSSPKTVSSSSTPEQKKRGKPRPESPLQTQDKPSSSPSPSPSPAGTLRRNRGKSQVESSPPLAEEITTTSISAQPLLELPDPVPEASTVPDEESPILPSASYKWDPDNFENINPFSTGGSKIANSPVLGRKADFTSVQDTPAALEQPRAPSPAKAQPLNVEEQPIPNRQPVRLEFDYSEDSGEASRSTPPPKNLGKKPGAKMPIRKPKLGIKKAPPPQMEQIDNAPLPALSNDNDDIPIPKASYNFDPSKWEDPNFNPFSSNTGIPNSPGLSKGSYSFESDSFDGSISPFKSSSKIGNSPPKGASFDQTSNDNENDNDHIVELEDHNQNKPAKTKKKPLKSNTFRVKKSPKRTQIPDPPAQVSQDCCPVCSPLSPTTSHTHHHLQEHSPDADPDPSQDHATDEEKLASSTNQKWTRHDVEVELTSGPQDFPQPTDFTAFVNENSFSQSDVTDYEIEYMEKIGSSAPPLSGKKPSLYLKLDSVTESTKSTSNMNDSEPNSPCTGSFEEMEAQISQGKSPVLPPRGTREPMTSDKSRKRDSQSQSRTQSNERDGASPIQGPMDPSDLPLLDRLSDSPAPLSYLEPDLAETNPTAFAQKLQEELVLAALRIEALQVAKNISQSPTLSTVSPQSRLKKPSPRLWNINGSHMAKTAVKSTQTDRKLCRRTSRIPQTEIASPGDSSVSKGSLYSRTGYIEGESPHLPRDMDHSLGIAREEIVVKEKEAMEWKRKYEESRREVEEMRRIVMEYEKTIAEMIEGEQREKSVSHHTIQQLILEKDQALADLNSVEKSLADLFRRYEKMKDVLEGFRKNEDVLKKCAQEYLSRVRKEEQRYQALKIHAEEKLDKANSEIAQVRAKAKQEQAAHQASLRKEQMKVDSLERTLEQKNKEIEELTKICDELIAKMGKS
nr:transforming acidic coiled-coil-containing protein 2 isoform X5 [Danio rerio]|eukprot:XP_021336530.1 transforming acidic coiled-coil-containing protein 2 isoform X5 [Danio rerio]